MAEAAHNSIMHGREEPFFADLSSHDTSQRGSPLGSPLCGTRGSRDSEAGRVCQTTLSEGPTALTTSLPRSAQKKHVHKKQLFSWVLAPVQAVAHHGKGNLNASTTEVVDNILQWHTVQGCREERCRVKLLKNQTFALVDVGLKHMKGCGVHANHLSGS